MNIHYFKATATQHIRNISNKTIFNNGEYNFGSKRWILFIIHWLIYRIPQRFSNLCGREGDLKEYSRLKLRFLEVNIQLKDMKRKSYLRSIHMTIYQKLNKLLRNSVNYLQLLNPLFYFNLSCIPLRNNKQQQDLKLIV